jgi:hypothetical protein
VSAFENIFDIVLVQCFVDETNRYAWQEIEKSVNPLTFALGLGSGKILQWTKC